MNETTPAVRHHTGIQWTHVPGYIGDVWNPTTGCTRVSPGCDHCYAFALHDQRYKVNLDAAKAAPPFTLRGPLTGSDLIQAKRREDAAALPMPAQYDVPFSQVQLLDEERLTAPLRARTPRAYFVDSMSDLFHEDVPDEFLDRVFAVMALSQYVGRCRRRECDHEGFSCEGHLDPPTRHIFMILTKRPERMRDYMTTPGRAGMVKAAQDVWLTSDHALDEMAWPLPNVWLGTSVEDQERADERIPILLDTPAAVRFLSCEPLLGPVDIGSFVCEETPKSFQMLSRYYGPEGFDPSGSQPEAKLRLRDPMPLDWVIVGGESGRGARPFDLAWARSLRDQCQAAGVPFFMKQLGMRASETVVHEMAARPLFGPAPVSHQETRTWSASNHHGKPSEWPGDLQVRQFPQGFGVWETSEVVR